MSATIRLRMHRDYHGIWADSEDIEHWTIVGRDAIEVMQLAEDAVQNAPELLDVDAETINVTWQWCDNPYMGVVAIRFAPSVITGSTEFCSCSRRAS